MSTEGLREAVHKVEASADRVSGFGDMSGPGNGLVAVAWAIVALAEALDVGTDPN